MKRITLRDWEHALTDAKRIFELPEPRVTLADLLQQEGAHESFGKLRDRVLHLTGTDITSVLGRSLQLIPTLPIRDPQEPAKIRRSAYRNSRGLNLKLRRLADELEKAWRRERERRNFYLDHSGERNNYDGLADLLRDCARFREAMYRRTRLVKSTTHPNPQLRMAQYVANFFFFIFGKRPYVDLALLFDAAFRAAGKPVPKWADPGRLRLEDYRRARRFQRIYGLNLSKRALGNVDGDITVRSPRIS